MSNRGQAAEHFRAIGRHFIAIGDLYDDAPVIEHAPGGGKTGLDPHQELAREFLTPIPDGDPSRDACLRWGFADGRVVGGWRRSGVLDAIVVNGVRSYVLSERGREKFGL